MKQNSLLRGSPQNSFSEGQPERNYWKEDKLSERLKGLSVQDATGQMIPFEKLFADKRTLIIFSRHFNCYLCKEQMKSLAGLPWEVIEKSNIDVKVVGCGRARAISSFANETGFPIDKCFVDSETNIYAALQLIRANNFQEIRSKKPSNQTFWQILSGLAWSGFSYCRRGKQGEVYQLGGAFLFGPNQQCSYKHIDESAEEHIQLSEIHRLLSL